MKTLAGAILLLIARDHLSAQQLGASAILLVLADALWLGFSNLALHPLRSYPGPRLFAAYRLPYIVAGNLGLLPFAVTAFHRRYGSVVRIAPDELAYNTDTAWKDIYGFRKGHAQLQKDPYFLTPPYPGMKPSIGTANDEDHAKYRRLLSHAFSAQAMSAQEPLIQQHVDRLMSGLHRQCRSGAQDMLQWFTWTTFDIVGDLAFGEPFGCLAARASHPWVETVLAGFAAGMMIATIRRYMPGGDVALASRLVPRRLLDMRRRHFEFAKEKLARRMALGNERPDFISAMMRHNDDAALAVTPEELQPNAALLVLAGGETTSTLLTGATYFLLRNPRVLARAAAEVRRSFEREADITFAAVSQRLHYLLAVLDESLRMYPPVATGLPRMTPPEGIEVDGGYVPGNMRVSVFQVAASRAPNNFHRADEFIPERWLEPQRSAPEFASDKRGATQPFGTGPRNCIGKNLAYMEMRLILAKLLWNFDLELDPGCNDWVNQKIYITWDKRPLRVLLTPRAERGGTYIDLV